jgi:cytochrome c oxidase cbb3-type subunit 3
MADYGMADFVSNFWHWFVLGITVVSILALFPLVKKNQEKAAGGKAQELGHVWDGNLKEYNNPLPGWWLNMFYITIVFAIVYLVLYPGLGKFQGIWGWSQKGAYDDEVKAAEAKLGPLYKKYAAMDLATLSKSPEAMKTGERLYANYCSLCHGADARGAKGFPDLRDADWSWGGEPEAIKASIMNGRTGIMPGWKAALTDAGVRDVTQYVLSLSARKHDADAAGRGKEKFEQTCAACHKADGTGNPAMGAPNLTDKAWTFGGTDATIADVIANGRQGRMPAHKEFLGEDKVHVLAAYMLSLSGGK